MSWIDIAFIIFIVWGIVIYILLKRWQRKMSNQFNDMMEGYYERLENEEKEK